MSCALCGSAIRKGQIYISIRAFVPITDAYGQRVDELMVMEDGVNIRYVHYGCVLRRCPELIGALNGEMRT